MIAVCPSDRCRNFTRTGSRWRIAENVRPGSDFEVSCRQCGGHYRVVADTRNRISVATVARSRVLSLS